MTEEKPIQRHKINRQENQKIVNLIKSKLTPLHQKHKPFPKILQPINMNKTTTPIVSLFSPKKQVILTQKRISLNRHHSNLNCHLSHPNSLVEKVNLHIEEKKKIVNSQEMKHLKAKIPRISLGSYLQLFSGFNGTEQRKQNSQFLKMKRQSQVLSIQPQIKDIVENSLVKDCQKQLSEQDICLMNAKYRKQMNHRKLIGIWKIKNRI